MFASEIKALLAFPDFEKKLNNDALYQYIHFQVKVTTHTFFKNINLLEPAHYLIIKNGKIIENKQYWGS